MQKARRHPKLSLRLRPLVSVWFQVLFTPLLGVLFTCPSRYWFTIGLLGVFSLTRWCWQSHTKFHRLRATQDTHHLFFRTCTGLSPSTVQFSKLLPLRKNKIMRVLQPHNPDGLWFGLIRFRSPLLTKSLLFSPPPGTQMFQFPGLPSANGGYVVFNYMGFPIRTSTDQSSFAAPRSLSQLTTSFVVSRSQGILHTLLIASQLLIHRILNTFTFLLILSAN